MENFNPHAISIDSLKAQALDLPSSAGIYRFHAQNSEIPVYIGKSINIRKRVLSHLSAANSNARERKLISMSSYVSCTSTPGELSALLLESEEIKLKQPLLNRRLRRQRQLLTFEIAPTAKTAQPNQEPLNLQLVPAVWPPPCPENSYFGLYASRTQAQRRLRDLATQHQLCLVTLGLEKPSTARSCFGYQLRRCAGACVGKECVQDHNIRFLAAVASDAIRIWPFEGPIGIKETAETEQIDVVDQWYYLGAYSSLDEAADQAKRQASGRTLLDRDAYRILNRWLYSPPAGAQLIPLWSV